MTRSVLNSASFADNSVTNAKIASNAVGTAELIDNNVTAAKLTPTSVTVANAGEILGSTFWSWDTSVASATNNGWQTMAGPVQLGSNVQNTMNNMLSVTFHGYISSGAYYWTWRIYDTTDNNVVLPVGASKKSGWYGNADGTGGGFSFRGSVHSASQQPAQCFDITGRDNHNVILQMHGSNGGGSSVSTSSQTLYADQIFFYAGFMSGMHNENGY